MSQELVTTMEDQSLFNFQCNTVYSLQPEPYLVYLQNLTNAYQRIALIHREDTLCGAVHRIK